MAAGVLTEEVLSPVKTSLKSTDQLHTQLVGSVRQFIPYKSIGSHQLLAKSLVTAGLARRILVQLSYAIAVAKPLSIYVDTYGTGKKTDEEIVEIIHNNWDLRPGVIGKSGVVFPLNFI